MNSNPSSRKETDETLPNTNISHIYLYDSKYG